MLELNLVKGQKRENEEAIATAQRLVREEIERRRLKVEKMKEEGVSVTNVVLGAEII